MQNCRKTVITFTRCSSQKKVSLDFEMKLTFPLINYLFVNNLSDKKRRESENQTHGTKSTTTSRSRTKSHAQQMIFISGKFFAFFCHKRTTTTNEAEAMTFEYKNVRLCMEANKLLTNC